MSAKVDDRGSFDWVIVSYEKSKANAANEARKRRDRGENARARCKDGQWRVEVWTPAYDD